jgi:hypothetical protein
MAEAPTQDASLVAMDDLLRDRSRQFVEFLDDEVSTGPMFVAGCD